MAFNEDPVLTPACLSPNLVVVVFFKGPRGRSISDPRADPLIMKGLLSGKTGLIKEWRDPSRPRDSFSVDLTVDDFRDGSEWLGHRFYLCGRFISLDESHVTYPSRLTSFFSRTVGPRGRVISPKLTGRGRRNEEREMESRPRVVWVYFSFRWPLLSLRKCEA